MDYEKKYKEALKWARKVIQGKVGFVLDEVLEKFPEIKESEEKKDERIIKALIQLVTNYPSMDLFIEYDIHLYEFVDWLEKQGEKSVNKLQVSGELYEHIRNTCACIEDALSSETLADINDYLSMAEHSAQSAFDMIEKQGKVEPKFKVGDIVKHKDNPHLTYILKRLTDDGDYEFHAIGKDGNEGETCFAVVKYQDEWELVERKLTWSEEEEKLYNRICDLIHEAAFANCETDEDGKELGEYAKMMCLLKSLRPQWKPSKEQLKQL